MVETQVYTIPLAKENDFIYLEPISCIHVGNIDFDETKFKERMKAIKTERNRYFIGMGDYADAITVGANQNADKRFNWLTLDDRYPIPDLQYNYVRDAFREVAHKCLGMHEGNHDYALEEKTTHQYVHELANSINVKYLGYAAFTVLNFTYRKKVIRRTVIFSGHGHYNGSQEGGNINWLKGLSSGFEADVYIGAHSHNVLSLKTIRIGVDNDGQLHEYPQVFVSAGSFLHSYQQGHMSYAEKPLLRPKKTGTATITFHPKTGKIYVFE